MDFRPDSGVQQQNAPSGTQQQRIHAERNPVRWCASRAQQLADRAGANADAEGLPIVGHDELGVMQGRQLQRADVKGLRRWWDRGWTEGILCADAGSKSQTDESRYKRHCTHRITPALMGWWYGKIPRRYGQPQPYWGSGF